MGSSGDAKAFVARAGDAETLYFPAQTIHLLADHADTGGAVSFIRSTLTRGACDSATVRTASGTHCAAHRSAQWRCHASACGERPW